MGERGPELVKLPGAAQVLNNTKSNSILREAFEAGRNPFSWLGGGGSKKFNNATFENATISLNTFKGGMQS